MANGGHYDYNTANMAAEQTVFTTDRYIYIQTIVFMFHLKWLQLFFRGSVKAENNFDGFEWSEEQVNLLLERMNGGGGGGAAAFFQPPDGQQQAVYKMEDVKAEALAMSPPHLVRYRVHDGKHVKTWQCVICKFCFVLFLWGRGAPLFGSVRQDGGITTVVCLFVLF